MNVDWIVDDGDVVPEEAREELDAIKRLLAQSKLSEIFQAPKPQRVSKGSEFVRRELRRSSRLAEKGERLKIQSSAGKKNKK